MASAQVKKDSPTPARQKSPSPKKDTPLKSEEDGKKSPAPKTEEPQSKTMKADKSDRSSSPSLPKLKPKTKDGGDRSDDDAKSDKSDASGKSKKTVDKKEDEKDEKKDARAVHKPMVASDSEDNDKADKKKQDKAKDGKSSDSSEDEAPQKTERAKPMGAASFSVGAKEEEDAKKTDRKAEQAQVPEAPPQLMVNDGNFLARFKGMFGNAGEDGTDAKKLEEVKEKVEKLKAEESNKVPMTPGPVGKAPVAVPKGMEDFKGLPKTQPGLPRPFWHPAKTIVSPKAADTAQATPGPATTPATSPAAPAGSPGVVVPPPPGFGPPVVAQSSPGATPAVTAPPLTPAPGTQVGIGTQPAASKPAPTLGATAPSPTASLTAPTSGQPQSALTPQAVAAQTAGAKASPAMFPVAGMQQMMPGQQQQMMAALMQGMRPGMPMGMMQNAQQMMMGMMGQMGMPGQMGMMGQMPVSGVPPPPPGAPSAPSGAVGKQQPVAASAAPGALQTAPGTSGMSVMPPISAAGELTSKAAMSKAMTSPAPAPTPPIDKSVSAGGVTVAMPQLLTFSLGSELGAPGAKVPAVPGSMPLDVANSKSGGAPGFSKATPMDTATAPTAPTEVRRPPGPPPGLPPGATGPATSLTHSVELTQKSAPPVKGAAPWHAPNELVSKGGPPAKPAMTVAAPPWRMKQPTESVDASEGQAKSPPLQGLPVQSPLLDMTTAKSKALSVPQVEPPGGFPSKAAPWESTVPKAKAAPNGLPPASPESFAAVSKASAVK